jgi:L-lactate dehydrogenase complex protein LldG
MAAAAAQIGWNVHRRSTPAEGADAVAEICKSEGVRTAALSEHDVFARVPVDSIMVGTGIELTSAKREPDSDAATDLDRRLALRGRMFDIDAGITGVDHGIAETGTVVINPRKGVSRLSSVAPPIHIAVMEAGQVLPSLDELFLLTRDDFLEGRHRGMVNLMTGPSRTADIEATLVTGVHGPLQVHLVIVG